MLTWKVLLLNMAILRWNISFARKPRILNGSVANIEDFPYQASFRHDNEHICGGSIISERHILTAGHCIYDYIVPPYENQTVVTGTNHIDKGGNIHKIAKITVHPNLYTNENRAFNDIAVITLRDKIVFNKYQQKIKLPKQNFKVGQKVIVTGWGLTQVIPEELEPNLLQQLQTKIISKAECQERVIDPENMKIYDTEVCTKNSKGSGMCWGDSGGPLAANGELIGIVSWSDGPSCGDEYPDVYTNVYKFRKFIESVINNSVKSTK